MKTSIKTLTTICAVVISLSTTAQPRGHGNGNGNQNKNNQRFGGSNWGGPHINVNIGTYPNYGGGYYYGNNYGNYYNFKKAARYSIRKSAQVIGQALNFSDWNDMYSPWLAKAIRHQQYAKQLYFWCDYAGAMNHAERAGFLAYNTLNYFNGYYGYDDGFGGGYNNYADPYSDPNNPYYRKGNPQGSSENVSSGDEGNDDSDFGYRKSNNGTTSTEGEKKMNSEKKMVPEKIDNSLPQSKMNDKELLKTNPKDLDIE